MAWWSGAVPCTSCGKTSPKCELSLSTNSIGDGGSAICCCAGSFSRLEQLLESYDEGVAEFLGLERVKPNTLGNSRMLLVL